MAKYWTLLSFVIFLSFWLAKSDDELIYVIEYARHGARYPGLKIAGWDNPLMLLTPAGMRQHFLLGSALRDRYVKKFNFLSPIYNPNEIAFYATNVSRCITSALSQIQGIYPPGSEGVQFDDFKEIIAVPPNEYDFSKWYSELGYNSTFNGISIIPVDSNLPDIFASEAICPHHYDPTNTLQTEAELQVKFASFYDELGTFFKKDKNMTAKYASELRDGLICGLYDGRFENEEYVLELINKTSPIYEYRKLTRQLNRTQNGVKMSKIYSSKILNRFADTLQNAASNETKTSMKMEVFVGTDTLMQAILLDLFGIFNPNQVPFCSVLLLELYKNNTDNTKYVKIMYNKEININMNLSDFIEKVRNSTISNDEIDYICSAESRVTIRNWDQMNPGMFILSGLFFISALLFALLFFAKKINERSNQNFELNALRS